jgi:hypothetical protein
MNAPMDKNTSPRNSQVSIVGTQSSMVGSQASMVGSQASMVGSQASMVSAQAAGRAAAGGLPSQGAPDIKAMLHRVVAHWPVVLVTMVLGAILTLQVVRMRKPTYKSETVISYHEGIARNITGPGDGGESVRNLGTKLKETLLAQQTLRKIIDEYHLYPDIVAKAGYADAVDQVRKKTDFKSRSIDTFAISFEGMDREQAQLVCARMAEILVTENARRLSDESKGTTEFLEVEKRRADEELDRVEREISEFLQTHPEFATAKDGLGIEAMAKQKAEDDEKKLAIRRSAPIGKSGSRGQPAAALTGPADERAPAVDPVLLTARTQAMTELINARKDLADKSLRYTDQHPDVRSAKDKVSGAEANVQRANDAIAAAQPKDEPAPRRRAAVPIPDDPYAEPSAKAAAGAAPTAAGDKPRARPKAGGDEENKVVSLEVEWARLGRVLSLARAHQVDLENKLYKAEMVASTAESGYGTAIGILDPAYRPSGPSNAPNRTVVMIGLALSVAVGLVISAAWGLFLDDRLFAPSEIEVIVMVPVLGTVPRAPRKGKGRDAGKPGARQGLSRA